jgi:hypothetical protein
MARQPNAACQNWIDRCHLPLLVGLAGAVSEAEDHQHTQIALSGGKGVVVAADLSAAVLREVQSGDLLCLRLNRGVAVTVDFVDGRPSLVSASLPHFVPPTA